MPGLYETIDAARAAGLKIALGSSSVLDDIEIILSALRLTGAFDAIVAGDQVAHGKPAPDIFLEAARRLEVEPARCLVLEDTAHGVIAAKAAGMLCVAVPGHFTQHQDFSNADMVLPGLKALDLGAIDRQLSAS
jgi:HAD superfamily hydrolase (TIGR01509 family)